MSFNISLLFRYTDGTETPKFGILKSPLANYFIILYMNEITLRNQWVIKAPIDEVFKIMTDFEKFPEHFPKVAESLQINKRERNNLEIEATVRSFGKKFKVKIKTHIKNGCV